MSERRQVTADERISARHVLQETMERVRQLRDAMDPRHGVLGLTDLQLATDLERIIGPLLRLEQKTLRWDGDRDGAPPEPARTEAG